MQQKERSSVLLGKTGLMGSRVGIGTWAIGGGWGPQSETQSLQTLHTALEQGCCLIDTAALYGNGRAEQLIGSVCKEQKAWVTTLTKIIPFGYHWAPAPGTPMAEVYPTQYIMEQVEGSLRRLQTDCLDGLLFQTWCPSWSEETAWYDTMQRLQQQGKIRAYGISVSDHRPDEANDIIAAGRVDLVEVAYSILDQRAAERLFPLAQHHQVCVIARTPLASGALAGQWYEGMKFHRHDWRRRVFRGELFMQTFERVERLKGCIAPFTSLPLAQIALLFCLSHPAVTAVIPGVRTPEQVICNFATLEQPPLLHEVQEHIARLWCEEFHTNVRTSIGEVDEGYKTVSMKVSP